MPLLPFIIQLWTSYQTLALSNRICRIIKYNYTNYSAHCLSPSQRYQSLLFYYSESEVRSLSRVRLFETPWTVAYQAPPSIRFSRQEYWRPGIKPRSSVLQAEALLSEPPGKPLFNEPTITTHITQNSPIKNYIASLQLVFNIC